MDVTDVIDNFFISSNDTVDIAMVACIKTLLSPESGAPDYYHNPLIPG